MPTSKLKCAVDSCQSRDGPFYRFPRSEGNQGIDRCLKWISATGNPALLELSHEKIYNRRICEKHFEGKFKLGSRLSKFAVPTLELPFTPLDFDSVMKCAIVRNHTSSSLEKKDDGKAIAVDVQAESNSLSDANLKKNPQEVEICNTEQAVNLDSIEIEVTSNGKTESDKEETPKPKGKRTKKSVQSQREFHFSASLEFRKSRN